jgi:hypothetical protein
VLVPGKGPGEDRIAPPLAQSSPPGKEVGRPRERRDWERRETELPAGTRRAVRIATAVMPAPVGEGEAGAGRGERRRNRPP